MDESTRRRYLRTVGVAAVAGLAGCGGGGGDGDGNGDGGDVSTVSGSEYPSIDEWLTETEIGPAADNYEGYLLDRTSRDSVTVDVGAGGNDGNYAYEPPAIVVSGGTEVQWRWTGEGNPHNVEAAPDEQLGESDYEFSSGPAEGGSGVKYTRTLDVTGIALYHCEPHLSLGMKGAIAVE